MDTLWDSYTRTSKGWQSDPIARVHPRIVLGSAAAVNLSTFHKYGITHAINCAEPEFTSKWFKIEFPDRYECINAEDSQHFDITTAYPKFETTMNRYLSDPECKTIYVHCQCGINRSAFLLLLYMCIKFHYSIESVAKNILIQRPCCFQNPAFRKQVVDYIKKLD
jgi:hypothetical protein